MESKDAYVVYFTESEDAVAEFPQLTYLANTLKGMVRVGVVRVNPNSPDFEMEKKEYKLKD